MSSCTSCYKFSTNKKLRVCSALWPTSWVWPLMRTYYWWPWRRLPFGTLVTTVHLRQFLEVNWDNAESHTLGGICQRPHIGRHLLKVPWNIQALCDWIMVKVILKGGLWPIMVMTSSRATFWWWGNWLSMFLKPKQATCHAPNQEGRRVGSTHPSPWYRHSYERAKHWQQSFCHHHKVNLYQLHSARKDLFLWSVCVGMAREDKSSEARMSLLH